MILIEFYHIVGKPLNELISFPTGGATYTDSKMKTNCVWKEDRGSFICVLDNSVNEGDPSLKSEFTPATTIRNVLSKRLTARGSAAIRSVTFFSDSADIDPKATNLLT